MRQQETSASDETHFNRGFAVQLTVDYNVEAWTWSSVRERVGPWPSGKASPLHGEDRRFESDRVHT